MAIDNGFSIQKHGGPPKGRLGSSWKNYADTEQLEMGYVSFPEIEKAKRQIYHCSRCGKKGEPISHLEAQPTKDNLEDWPRVPGAGYMHPSNRSDVRPFASEHPDRPTTGTVEPKHYPKMGGVVREFALHCPCGCITVFGKDSPSRRGAKGHFAHEHRVCKCGATLPPLKQKPKRWEARCKCGNLTTILDEDAGRTKGVIKVGRHYLFAKSVTNAEGAKRPDDLRNESRLKKLQAEELMKTGPRFDDFESWDKLVKWMLLRELPDFYKTMRRKKEAQETPATMSDLLQLKAHFRKS